jgi:uroporphyrinogen III methyltransferase/synthase
MKQGIVYLVGAGPGDPGLITVKGRDCLRLADVVVYDYLSNPCFLEQAPADAERIYVGKRKGMHHYPQEKITDLLLDLAQAGKTVVRLKGGDPFIFGRGGEEAQALAAAGVRFEIVPGVTSAVAAAAYAGIPMTHRDFTTTLGFATGHENPEKKLSSLDWEKLATAVGTLVFYMGMANLENICEQLIAHGRSPETPVAIIRWATTPKQETLVGNLSTIVAQVKSKNFKPPALIFVGEVVALRESLRWFDNRPLFGKRVLVTRTAAQAGRFSRQLEAVGAEALSCPVIEIVPPPSYAELDTAIGRLPETDYLILTSANAVDAFFTRLTVCGKDVRDLYGVTVAVVGPKTAETLQRYGLKADLVAADFRAEGVIAQLRQQGVNGKLILYPHAELARDVITRELTAADAEVAAPIAYSSRIPDNGELLRKQLQEGGIDAITFTASSTVDNFIALLGEQHADLIGTIPLFSIGPLTSETMARHNLTIAAESSPSTLEALIDSMTDYFQNQNNASTSGGV